MILVDRSAAILGQITTVAVAEISVVETSQEAVVVMVNPLEIGAKIMAISVEIKEVEVEEGLIPAQLLEDLG